jgi:16S rRNA (uracil1498-N3)-methyltransferase
MADVRVPLPGTDLAAPSIPLPPPAVRYVTVVRRLEPGAPLVLFDGLGHEVEAVLVRDGERWAARPSGPPRAGRRGAGVTLCWGLPKGDKLEDGLRQVTELGVERVVALACERSVVRLERDRADRRRERWARVAAEAARQCGRADAPAVDGPLDLDAAIAATADAAVRLVLHPEGGVPLAEAALAAPVALFVGPEGGFAPAELARLAAAGAERVTLGGLVLRTETAATVGTALVLHRLGVL